MQRMEMGVGWIYVLRISSSMRHAGAQRPSINGGRSRLSESRVAREQLASWGPCSPDGRDYWQSVDHSFSSSGSRAILWNVLGGRKCPVCALPNMTATGHLEHLACD